MAKVTGGDSENLVVRAVVLPVAAPEGMSWADLDRVVNPLFRLATDAANWCVHALFKRDTPNHPAMPAAVKPRGKTNPNGFYSYGEYAKAHPDYLTTWKGATQSLNICLRYAERKYRAERFDVMVRHVTGLLTVKYPYPFPVDADAWSVRYGETGEPIASLGLPGRCGQVGRVEVRLRRGPEFGRQLALLRMLADGSAKKGEAALSRDRKGRLRVKFVGHFPRRERGPATNVAYVHTDPAALLVCEINGHRVTVTNGDHLKRWQAAHRAYLQRTGEDMKREVRMDRRHRANLNTARALRCGKHRHRMDTAVKQIAAQVARMCERKGVGLVCYDDPTNWTAAELAARSFMGEDSFPWHALKERLRVLLAGEMGCDWVDGKFAHITDTKERGEWLTIARNTATAGRRALASKNRPGPHPAVTPNSPPKRSRARTR